MRLRRTVLSPLCLTLALGLFASQALAHGDSGGGGGGGSDSGGGGDGGGGLVFGADPGTAQPTGLQVLTPAQRAPRLTPARMILNTVVDGRSGPDSYGEQQWQSSASPQLQQTWQANAGAWPETIDRVRPGVSVLPDPGFAPALQMTTPNPARDAFAAEAWSRANASVSAGAEANGAIGVSTTAPAAGRALTNLAP